MIISIVIGLIIWFAVPLLFTEKKRKKSQHKAIEMTCRIIGIAIIVWAVISNFL